MDFETQVGLLMILNITLAVLGVIVGLLLTYLVIRQGVFHGLRAHTRWIDSGKDYKKIR
ncbi:hypothetical protein [Microbacterium hydrocarbonoxydans]|uniref:Uncharacterized protein n=1 Tax=Microbacterium hydrocarbonoxydans TaxID=273678 RepID=A0A1H4KS34_9MICO|nr:hypothetical protein [Microbacterium hydrocarbonoxydans]SEB61350.1 hypothetical protein SAMN04489807_1524 [Microbacterium hydrocarbonoxydans]